MALSSQHSSTAKQALATGKPGGHCLGSELLLAAQLPKGRGWPSTSLLRGCLPSFSLLSLYSTVLLFGPPGHCLFRAAPLSLL